MPPKFPPPPPPPKHREPVERDPNWRQGERWRQTGFYGKGRYGDRGGGERAKWHTARIRAERQGPEALARFLAEWPQPPPSKAKAKQLRGI